MIDAERHRIRREFFGERQERCRHEHAIGQAHGFHGKRRNGLMAKALAIVARTRSIFAMFRRSLRFVVGAAVTERIEAVTRQHEKGHDGDEQAGAKETHGRDG